MNRSRRVAVVLAITILGLGCGPGEGETAAVSSALLDLSRPAATPTPSSGAVLFRSAVTVGGTTYVRRSDGVLTPTVDPSFFKPSAEALSGSQKADTAPRLLTAPSSYSLASWQTPIRDQQDRGTCGVFASVAAIEARYRRDYGLSLDLSEQYLMHVVKGTSLTSPRYYQYENQSSYWYGAGSWSIALAASYPLPVETDAPYLNQGGMDAVRTSIPAAGALIWNADPALNPTTQAQVDAFEYSPLYISLAARRNAKYGVSSYTLLDSTQARDTSLIENYISTNNEVAIDVALQWRYDSTTGIYQYDSTVNYGGHAMLIIGYDRAQNYFLLKNSWGGSSYVKVSYGFIQNAAYSAAVVNGVTDPSSPVGKAQWLGVWNTNHDGWAGRLVIRRVTDTGNAATRLGTYYAGTDSRDVNGYHLQGGRGVYYYVAPSSTETAPGTLTGQPFEMYYHGWDPTDASGYTWSGGARFGSVAKRTTLAIPYGNSFDASKWLGSWAMNHDGWHGQLLVTSSGGGSLSGTYTLEGGSPVPMTGTYDTTRPASATFTIGNPGSTQSHYVDHYSWSRGFFAGVTYWSGYPFGSQGSRFMLDNGVAQSGLSGASASQQVWAFEVPSGRTSLTINLTGSGSTGDADLYVRYAAVPTLSAYNCRPYIGGNSETCTFSYPAAGTWYVMLNGYSAYGNVTLSGSY